MPPLPRPGILDIAPYVPGESQAHGGARVCKLSSNEGALGPSPRAQAAYRQAAADLHRYPDGGSGALTQALGRRWGLDPAQIVCGAGSDELITLLIRAYAGPGDEVLYSRHGFLMYPIAAQSAGATPVTAPERDLCADVDALLAAVTPRTRVVCLANPNNPTGSYLPADAVARLHAGLPDDVLLLLDSAYSEFVTRNDYSDGAELAGRAANIVMTRTFSKIYGLAALRLGWAYGAPALIDVLHRIRGPFNVSLPAQAAGIAAIEDEAHLAAARAHNAQWLPWLSEKLTGLGLTVIPSVGNFLLVRFPGGAPVADAAFAFLSENGVIVRKMGGYGLPDALRITIGPAAEVEIAAATLARFPALS